MNIEACLVKLLQSMVDVNDRTLLICIGKGRIKLENGINLISFKCSETSTESEKVDQLNLNRFQCINNINNNIHIIFLEKLQYLFMFLMKMQIGTNIYNRILIYGLDLLFIHSTKSIAEAKTSINNINNLNYEQIRCCNLIFNAIFKINRQTCFKLVKFIYYYDDKANHSENESHQGFIDIQLKEIKRLEKYWKEIYL